jgi:hypothetical protein
LHRLAQQHHILEIDAPIAVDIVGQDGEFQSQSTAVKRRVGGANDVPNN